jgi:hypothetical protein
MGVHLMKPMFKLVILLICLFCVYGCGSIYNTQKKTLFQTATQDDYGPPPPQNHLQVEKRLLLSFLKDSAKAQLFWKQTRRDIIPRNEEGLTPALVWISPVDLNTKQKDGSFSEVRTFYFAWSQGELFALALPENESEEQECRRWTYLN